MELQKLLSSCFFLFTILITGHRVVVQGSSDRHQLYGIRPTKLFVFGDSYSDTGNNGKSVSESWNIPYGITFPGKPAGRFSDGRVLTDYLAKFVGLKSPIPYKWRKLGAKRLRFGMNFACGGTGVFDTLALDPNMTTQINYFERLINDSVYTKRDLKSSVALVTLAGNDYGAYYAKGGTTKGLLSFIKLVINQLAMNLKRIHEMGVRRVAMTALEPLGCLPRSTIVSSFQHCNETQNMAVAFHNLLLQQAVAKLNNESSDSSSFVVLDLFESFTAVLNNKGGYLENLKFETPLKPCCMGISNGYSCGSMDEKGVKMYTVCEKPQSAFFWDGSHPTQAGWNAVYLALQSTLQQIY